MEDKIYINKNYKARQCIVQWLNEIIATLVSIKFGVIIKL